MPDAKRASSAADMLKKFIETTVLVCLCFALATAQAGPGAAPSQQSDDVVRVSTELVQTDVMVFDKQGRFIEGLGQKDFELRIDGETQPIRFFERVKAGAVNEDAQLAAARGASQPGPTREPAPLDRGRPVFFFVDDMHMSIQSLDQTRKLLRRFIDQDLKQNDQAEIATASGRLGFLQQLTDNKKVLRTAVENLTTRKGIVKDMQHPPMSEYQALQIDRGDRDTLGFFADAVMAEMRMTRSSAEDEVRRRALMLLEQAASLTTTTLSSLDDLVRSCAKVPGRKLIFLISDGFFIDTRNSHSIERMRFLTSAAARTATVIYSVDSRGLIARLDEAGDQVAVDPTGRLSRGSQGEIGSSQDSLNALARDTGGRALFNTNDLHIAVDNGLKETATYYLLAWRPGHEGNIGKFRRLEVSVIGRPELTVRVRRGFFDTEPQPAAAKNVKGASDQKAGATTAETMLRDAIMSPYPDRQIPISLSLNYLDTIDKGPSLSISMLVPGEFLLLNSQNKEGAQIDLAGAVFDLRGQVNDRFGQRVTLTPNRAEASAADRELTYNHSVVLKPGLYQIRVAARDIFSGYTGSENSWIEIPDLSDRKLALSSLIVGERSAETLPATANVAPSLAPGVRLNIDRHFRRDSFLRYIVFVYNASTSATKSVPDVVAQVQVLRDNQPVATTSLKPIPTEGVEDIRRLPYAADISLEGLSPGRYVLQFTAIDRVSASSATQQIRFEIR